MPYITGPNHVTAGQQYTLNLYPNDAFVDHWMISWGDGATTVVPASSAAMPATITTCFNWPAGSRAMLKSAEHTGIKADYDQVSRTHFSKSYFYPEGMSFARNEALFPEADLAGVIRAEYEAQCRMLCYRPYASWV